MFVMVRCTRCRFLFEAPLADPLPPCVQCGGHTAPVFKIEPLHDPAPRGPRTLKFPAITDAKPK
jgi:hypothetical protein